MLWQIIVTMPPKKGDDILLLMEKKFDELKGQFINEMNKQIQKIVEVELNKLSVVYEKRTAALESELNSLHMCYEASTLSLTQMTVVLGKDQP